MSADEGYTHPDPLDVDAENYGGGFEGSGYAEGVRRSAEYMRLHHDEPNEYTPRSVLCVDCLEYVSEEDASRCPNCDDWRCDGCRRSLGPDCLTCKEEAE